MTSHPRTPTVLLLDGDYDNTLQIAKELSQDLDSHVVGVGTSRFSRLLHSRYCDEGGILPAPGTDEYPSALLSFVERVRPDVVLPVGARSVAVVDAIRDRIPEPVGVSLPPSTSLEIALDKRRTLSLADRLGIDVPPDYTAQVAGIDDRDGDPDTLDRLPFPLFLKARRETGKAITGKVSSPESFWTTYEGLRRANGGGDVLVQEWVGGSGPTYGCGVLFTDDGPELTFCHVEHRSVPPRGGSGTRLEAIEDPALEATTIDLLSELDWRGIALVEYKVVDGSYVLMEINPKFWASYALASQCGYRFASTLVADCLGRSSPAPPHTVQTRCKRVFPLRELAHCLGDPDASVVEAMREMLFPPARPALNVEDPVAWLMPPVDVVRGVPALGVGLGAFVRASPGPYPEDVVHVDADGIRT